MGLGEQGGGLLSRLIAGGTRRVLGETLKSWQSLRTNAAQDVGGREGAAAAASVAGETMQVWYGGSGIWAEDCEGNWGHFQMDRNPVGLSPNKGALWSDGLGEHVKNRASGPLNGVVVRVGSEPRQEARQGVRPDLPDRLSGFAGAGVAVESVGVTKYPFREGAACIGWLDGWRRRRRSKECDDDREQDKRQQSDSESDLHGIMMEAVRA